MLENFIMLVRRPKGVLSESVAFVVSQRKPAQQFIFIKLD